MSFRGIKYFVFISLFILVSFSGKTKRTWSVVELSYADGWYTGFAFRLNADGSCEWQRQNSDPALNGKLMKGMATSAMMEFLDEIVTTKEFLADTSYFGCIDCDTYWLYVKYNDNSYKLESFVGARPGNSGKIIRAIESFTEITQWKDSSSAPLRLQLIDKIDEKWEKEKQADVAVLRDTIPTNNLSTSALTTEQMKKSVIVEGSVDLRVTIDTLSVEPDSVAFRYYVNNLEVQKDGIESAIRKVIIPGQRVVLDIDRNVPTGITIDLFYLMKVNEWTPFIKTTPK